jgi:hypothetical protein
MLLTHIKKEGVPAVLFVALQPSAFSLNAFNLNCASSRY